MEQAIIDKLYEIVSKDRIFTSKADLYAYGFDASIHHAMPSIVVKPKSSEEVEEIVKLANEYSVPVIARGAGTALCGQAVPIYGGILLDMTGMDKIKEIRIEDLYCVVEPGVIYAKLNEALAEYGFFFPPTPGSGDVCTIGGMIAVNASGMRAIKYGATRDYVLGLEIVFPYGRVRFGSKTLKNSAGYQVERLIVGSEGTLGIITEATLRISPLPEKRAVALASFNDVVKAGEGVAAIIAGGMLPSALEIMDKVCIEAVKKAMSIDLPDAEALLLIEVDGKAGEVKEGIEKIAKILEEKADKIEFTDDEGRMTELWKGRKGVLPSLSRYGEDMVSVSLADDMSVPISKIPYAIKEFQNIARKYGIIVGTYGHAGDGNLHTKVLINPKNVENWKKAEKAVGEIYKVVYELGGIASGEHGIGITKAPWINGDIETMERIKKAIDPNNIMNPGKMDQWKKSIIAYLRYK
ncbi:MAG: FAD-binding oxidoreductase [Thermoplasmata archaeon]|nr:MAG: FAD-binding oxidoreductase [Thermoplasmata archaeon]